MNTKYRLDYRDYYGKRQWAVFDDAGRMLTIWTTKTAATKAAREYRKGSRSNAAKAKRGGFGRTGRRIQTQKVYDRVAPSQAQARRAAMKKRGNPRTVEAVATRTIRAGEKFRIKVR